MSTKKQIRPQEGEEKPRVIIETTAPWVGKENLRRAIIETLEFWHQAIINDLGRFVEWYSNPLSPKTPLYTFQQQGDLAVTYRVFIDQLRCLCKKLGIPHQQFYFTTKTCLGTNFWSKSPRPIDGPEMLESWLFLLREGHSLSRAEGKIREVLNKQLEEFIARVEGKTVSELKKGMKNIWPLPLSERLKTHITSELNEQFDQVKRRLLGTPPQPGPGEVKDKEIPTYQWEIKEETQEVYCNGKSSGKLEPRLFGTYKILFEKRGQEVKITRIHRDRDKARENVRKLKESLLKGLRSKGLRIDRKELDEIIKPRTNQKRKITAFIFTRNLS